MRKTCGKSRGVITIAALPTNIKTTEWKLAKDTFHTEAG
jgi:hypothetical protein